MVEYRDGVAIRYGTEKGKKRGAEILRDTLGTVDTEKERKRIAAKDIQTRKEMTKEQRNRFDRKNREAYLKSLKSEGGAEG